MASLDPWADLSDAVEQATPEQCPRLMGELERLKASLWLKMTCQGQGNQAPQPDRLLTADEVATRLNISTDYVYRHAKQYPFMIRQGRRVRFSQAGLERYLKQRQGR